MTGAIVILVMLLVIAAVSFVYFTIQDKKAAKKHG